MSLKMQIVGVKEALQAFRDVPRKLQNKHLRIGLMKAGGMLRAAAAANVPVESGALKKSLRVKAKIPDASFNKAHHGKPAYIVVGPGRQTQQYFRRADAERGSWRGFGKAQKTHKRVYKENVGLGLHNFQAVTQTIRFTKHSHNAVVRVPARYAHLVEKGFRHRLGFSVPGKHFLAKAARTTGPAAQAAVIQRLRQGLEMEANIAYARSIGKFR